MKKNIIAIMMAIVALFATQCKKQTEPMTNQPAGETMKVTVRVENNTAKTGITATGAVTWKEGDKLYVVGSEQGLLGYVSALTNGKSVNFEGLIIPLNAASQKLRFYYVGDQEFTLDADGNYTFSLANQDGTLEGIAAHNQLMFGTTSENIAAGTTNFGTIQMTSLMAIAHLKFIFPSEGNKTINAGGVVMVTDGYATSTFNAKNYGGTSSITGTKGTITMTSSSPITECYIALLPGEQTLSFTYNNAMYSGSLDEEDVVANKFYNSENPIVVECKPNIPDGALSGKFSVSATKQVYFSIGNLQYHPKNNKWRFAESQEDVCDKTKNLHDAIGYSQNSDTWIDLFGWGTSNYDHNDSGCHPWNTSSTNSNYYPYGTTWGNDLNSIDGMADWGKANATDLGEGWYTLSKSEWQYMLFTRKINGATGVGKAFARATIQDANGETLYGLVIFPDDYSGSQSPALSSIPEGCAFLPCAGHRTKANVNGYLTSGYYWTSTHHSNTNYAWNLAISSNQDYVTEFRPSTGATGDKVYAGISVRLVHDVPAN